MDDINIKGISPELQQRLAGRRPNPPGGKPNLSTIPLRQREFLLIKEVTELVADIYNFRVAPSTVRTWINQGMKTGLRKGNGPRVYLNSAIISGRRVVRVTDLMKFLNAPFEGDVQ